MIQEAVESGKNLKAGLLQDLESLRYRNVPLKRILVAEEQQLPEFAWSPVRNQERGVGAAIGPDQLRVNCEPLQISAVRSVQSSALRVEQFLNLFEGYTRGEPDAVCASIVGGAESAEPASQLNGLPRA